LDQLEATRTVLLDQLLEIDQTMEKPKDEDIERVRDCQLCYDNGEGPPCIMCELDGLFQVCYIISFNFDFFCLIGIYFVLFTIICFFFQQYEARLFRINKDKGGMVTSAEEVVDLQKKNSALNRFLWNLPEPNRTSKLSTNGHEESKKRDVRYKVVVSYFVTELLFI